MLRPARSVLHTGLANLGAILHPVITLLNADRIKTGDSFDFYCRGRHPDGAADAGRRRRGTPASPAPTACRPALSATGSPELTTTAPTPSKRQSAATRPMSASRHLRRSIHRYLLEDVPTGLIPLVELGKAAGLALPVLIGTGRSAPAHAGR